MADTTAAMLREKPKAGLQAFGIVRIVHGIFQGRKIFSFTKKIGFGRHFRHAACLAAMLLSCHGAQANSGNCWEASATKYGVDPFLLAAIGRVESSFNPKAYNRNKDGTEDIGIMQINTKVLHEVSRFGITRDQLFEPCINIDVAAWKLASHFQNYGVTWFAVGAYHSKTPTFNRVYQMKVYLAFLKLTGSTQIGGH